MENIYAHVLDYIAGHTNLSQSQTEKIRGIGSNMLLEEEKKRLEEALSDLETEYITIDSYYKRLRIRDESSCYSIPMKLHQLTGSTDSFFEHEIPSELVEIVEESIDGLNRFLDENYDSIVTAPETKNYAMFIRKVMEAIYDFGVFAFSLGNVLIVRESEEEYQMRNADSKRRVFEQMAAVYSKFLAEQMMENYLMFEASNGFIKDNAIKDFSNHSGSQHGNESIHRGWNVGLRHGLRQLSAALGIKGR